MIARYLGERSDIGAADDEIVKILQGKIPDERAPDGDVIEDRPVGRVECDLHRDDNDQDGGDDAANQLMIRSRVPLMGGTVKIGTCIPQPPPPCIHAIVTQNIRKFVSKCLINEKQ